MSIPGEKNCRVLIGGRSISTVSGKTISQLLHEEALAIEMPCGASGKCGKCKVIAQGDLSPVESVEQELLTPEELAAQIRLACCARICGDCTITFLRDSELANIAVHGVTDILVSKRRYQHYGLAIDIGTTTIAMKLFDQKRELAAHSGRNGQACFGADVITRIDKSLHGEAQHIQQVTVNGLNEMIAELCLHCGISPKVIDLVVITGNTAMMYLLTGANPDCLAHTPFIADRLYGETLLARELGLALAPETEVYLSYCMAAYVGGDISSAILASGMTSQPDTSLLVDIGTNGEMALWHQQRLICCSTAAGPAFEGAEISMGMNAMPGAIDQIWLQDNNIHYHVIGDLPPQGLCGSGIIDAVSVLKDLALIDESGALAKEVLAERHLAKKINGQWVCRIASEVYLSQKDIRMVQLAKSAICAGILTLIDKLGITVGTVQKLYLAGGFGNYLNMASAANIGLLPSLLALRTQVIGNAALHGAAMVLTDQRTSEKNLLQSLPVEVLDLAASPLFMDNYIAGMGF